MKRRFGGLVLVAVDMALIMMGCASAGRTDGWIRTPPVSGLLTLDQAMAEICAAVEEKVEQGSEVGVAKIEAPLPEIGDFLYDELLNALGSGGKLVVLARGKDLETLTAEFKFQESGLVSDDSAVEFGQQLGAKVMITCSFSRFGNFSQLSARALDVKTARILAVCRSRIRNNDPVLTDVIAPLRNVNLLPITEDALAHLNQGKDYFVEGKYDEAIGEFDKALAISDRLDEAWFFRGTAYSRNGYQDRAMADYNAALRINPNHITALNNRGAAYGDKGDYDRAIADYNAALRINPNYVTALNNRGVAYNGKGDYDRAIADFTAALQINPNYALVCHNRGLAYNNKGDYDRAIADYTAALRLNPNNAGVLNDRGIAYYRKNDYDRAIADFTAALQINPNYDRALCNRGAMYNNKGDYDRAIADFTAALRINPNDDVALNNRGESYREKGDYDRAIADYTAALKINPNNTDALSSVCL